MKKRSDENVIRQLQSIDERTVDDALSYLYEVSKKTVRFFILKNRGNEEDVDDIFHDGLIAFYNLARRDKLKMDTKVEAYLYTICRNIWSKKIKNRPTQEELTETFHSIPVEDLQIQTILDGEKKELIDKLLKDLGPDCQQLLLYYYFDHLRMKEIVKKMNFSNDQVARNKKSNCMKKLREVILNSPLYQYLLK